MTRTISDLSESDVDRFLRGEGLCLRTGPFLYRIKSDVPKLASAIRLLYADFAIPQRDSESLVDYHVSVRRWFMGNCRFGLLGSFTSQPLPLSCAFAALEWGLNTCIYNEGQLLLLLHAAVVEREGEALLLVGESGSGKSTLCAALTLSGWRLLSDELAMIATSDGNLSATARPIILKNESISVIRRFSERAVLGPIAHSKARGTVAHLRPPRASIERMDDRALASGVLFVEYRDGAAADLRPITPGQAMLRMAAASFNFGILGKAAFSALGDTIDRCDLFDLIYGDLTEALRLIDQQFPVRASSGRALTA